MTAERCADLERPMLIGKIGEGHRVIKNIIGFNNPRTAMI